MGKKTKLATVIFFHPNGLGDLIMFSFFLEHFCKKYKYNKKIVVVLDQTQKIYLDNKKIKNLQVITKYNKNNKFNFIYILFFLLIQTKKRIYAPLLANKITSRLFLLALQPNVFVPAFTSKIFSKFFQISRISFHNYPGHQVNYYFDFFNSFQSENKSKINFFSKPILQQNQKKPTPKKYYSIILGPFCSISEVHKIPSTYLFAKIVNCISENLKIKVVLINTSREKNKTIELINKIESNVEVQVLTDLPIVDLIKIARTCDLGIAGTTGQGHLISASGIPMLVLAGVTNPYHSGPFAVRAAILKHNLPCSPCYQEKYRFGCGYLRCMELLDPKKAAAMAIKLITNNNYGRNWQKKGQAVFVKEVSKIKNIHNSIFYS